MTTIEQLITDFRNFIGDQPCECVRTPEYEAWQREWDTKMEPLSTLERYLHHIFAEEPEFENDGIATECERCRLLGEIATIGDNNGC